MWRILLVGLTACGADADSCELLEEYSAAYEVGYTDGSTCAAYDNPYEDDVETDIGDTAAGGELEDSEADDDACLWAGYDAGFNAGRTGADCSAGLD